MVHLKAFGKDYDISTKLNQLIDEENRSVRRQNQNIIRELKKLQIHTEESDIGFDKSDHGNAGDQNQNEDEGAGSTSINILSSGGSAPEAQLLTQVIQHQDVAKEGGHELNEALGINK